VDGVGILLHQKFDLPLLVLTVSAIISGFGRIAAKASAVFRRRFMRAKEADLTRLGAFLDEHRNYVAPATFLYVLTPFPTNNLFIAAGMVGVNLGWVLAGFWAGRILADTFWVWTTDRVFNSLGDVFGTTVGGRLAIGLQQRSRPGIAVPAAVGRWLRHIVDHNQTLPLEWEAHGGARSAVDVSRDRRQHARWPRRRRAGFTPCVVGDRRKRKRERSSCTAEDVTRTKGDMKGAVMKFGQIMSLMSGVVPDEMSAQLATLQSNAPPMSYHLVEEVFQREFGRPPVKVFRKFEHEPFAAASIGQVHRATLHDGTRVAVKVQYPGVREAIGHDLANVGILCAWRASYRAVSCSPIIVTSDGILGELDYLHGRPPALR
jgi:hypothetical protein